MIHKLGIFRSPSIFLRRGAFVMNVLDFIDATYLGKGGARGDIDPEF
jgi:hypothetical protein